MDAARLTVRQATPDDYKSVHKLYRMLDHWHETMHPDLFQPHDGPARTEEYVRSVIDAPDKALLVAEVDGGICGLLELLEETTPDYAMFIPRRTVKIDSLVVAEAYRRQGMACALTDAAYAWARERGIDTVRLKVYSANADALAFYADAGFARLSEVLELRL